MIDFEGMDVSDEYITGYYHGYTDGYGDGVIDT